MSKADLRRQLEAVVAADFAPPTDRAAVGLARDALEAIGSPDPALRDELAYRVLADWIHNGVLSVEDVRELLFRAASDEMLFSGIGEAESESVFRRSFSLLIIAVGLARDADEPFLTEDEWRRTLERIVSYGDQECDLRAFVDIHGWAHAAAHAADVVDELVRSRYATHVECTRLFGALRTLVNRAGEVFQGEEDERLAIALSAMLTSRKVTPAELRTWFHAEASGDLAGDFAAHVRRVNWKLVARSLLVRLQREESARLDGLEDIDRPFTIS